MDLLLNIGGTKLRMAVSRNQQTIEKELTFPTPKDFNQAMDEIKNKIPQLTQESVENCMVGVAGILNQAKSALFHSPNLTGWNNQPLKEKLAEITHGPVYLENDSALEGLAEAVRGAGAGKKIVAYFSIGTGIGGCRVTNGQIDDSSFGFEPGHQLINTEGSPRGLEELVCGQIIDTPEERGQAALKFAIGAHNSIVHWSPEIVVIGGGIGLNLSLDEIRDSLGKSLTFYPQIPQVEYSSLKEEAGFIGGLLQLSHLKR